MSTPADLVRELPQRREEHRVSARPVAGRLLGDGDQVDQLPCRLRGGCVLDCAAVCAAFISQR